MKKYFIIIGLYAMLILISCNQNKNNTSQIKEVQLETINTEQPKPNLPIDTISLIKGNCFLLSNLSGSGSNQQQYKRLITFNSTEKSCTYSIIDATYNKMVGREFDGRTKGIWKIIGDKLIINWDGYYESRGLGARDSDDDFIDDNTGKSLRPRREILGEYKIQIIDGKLNLIFSSETVKYAELDEFLNYERDENHERELAYNLPYNENTQNIVFERVDCTNAKERVLTRDFVPQKNESDRILDQYRDEYNKKHSCSDQRSFDAGYDLAREQRGVTYDEDLDLYLYKLTQQLGLDYNGYCFKKGVIQYINDKKSGMF